MGAFYKYIDKITNNLDDCDGECETCLDPTRCSNISTDNEDYEITNPNYNKSELEILGNELNK